MPEIKFDWGWVSRELNAAGSVMGSPSNEAIAALLVTLTRQDLTDQEKEFVVTSFASIVRGNSLPRPNEEFETWKDCVPGDYMIGDSVRVRSSAYQGEHGMWHNGRRGKVIGTRNNSVVVRYDDEGAEDARHHDPGVLEVLVP